MTQTMLDDPADAETIMIMAEIHRWLDHWQDVLSEPDGPAHASAFLDSIPKLLHSIMVIMNDDA
jgi:hypothetical protein